eukprot:TRINITY_DN80522_c0_g1_i1.p1 TRINITY_DN80522_c0_g1~~TRINITY_DN80522_c0_g1_i1.p1  ORF type:complete len:299 (-),score=53.43 TRINITY_DN80522_c0_g1_i1:197-1093(-)
MSTCRSHSIRSPPVCFSVSPPFFFSSLCPFLSFRMAQSDKTYTIPFVEPSSEKVLRVLVLGDEGVGKSTFLHTFCHGKATLASYPTNACALWTHLIEVDGDVAYFAEFLEIAGSLQRLESRQSIISEFPFDAIIAVFDLTSSKSLDVVHEMIQQAEGVSMSAGKHPYVILLANKLDIYERFVRPSYLSSIFAWICWLFPAYGSTFRVNIASSIARVQNIFSCECYQICSTEDSVSVRDQIARVKNVLVQLAHKKVEKGLSSPLGPMGGAQRRRRMQGKIGSTVSTGRMTTIGMHGSGI